MSDDAESSVFACTLAANDHKDRMAWIEELNAAALRGYRREGLRIELMYDPSAAARVREFVDREQQCCPFLDFTMRHENGSFILVIDSPEDASEAADALFAPYVLTRDPDGD